MGRLVPGSLRVKVSNVPWLQADSTLKPLQRLPDGTGICIENGIKNYNKVFSQVTRTDSLGFVA